MSLVACALWASAVSAQDVILRTSPENPVESQDITVRVSADLVGLRSAELIGVVVDDLSIDVLIETTPDLGPAGSAPLQLRELFDLAALGVGGDYQLSVYLVDAATRERSLLATQSLRVRHRIEIDIDRFPRSNPLRERFLVTFQSRGLYCLDRPVINPGHILVSTKSGCASAGPAPDELLAFEELEWLAPGNWVIQVIDEDGQQLGLDRFVVYDGWEGMLHGRFRVITHWSDYEGGSGVGTPANHQIGDSLLFWFFSPENPEVMVKVLDGCGVNGHYWVLTSASTDVEYDIQILDFASEHPRWRRTNALGERSPAFVDVEAFDCSTETDDGE